MLLPYIILRIAEKNSAIGGARGMRLRKYNCKVLLSLYNINLSSISKDNVVMRKEDEDLLDKLYIDGQKRVTITSKTPFIENVEYLIVISKSAQLANGGNLPDDIYVPFKIVDGKAVLQINQVNKMYLNPKGAPGATTQQMVIVKRIEFKNVMGFVPLLLALALVFALWPQRVYGDQSYTPVAERALNYGFSTQVTSGTILSHQDNPVEVRNVYIIHSSGSRNAVLYIWDWASEDGDSVIVTADDEVILEETIIRNEPQRIVVPATGTVEVHGMHDGGGGITYAVYCSLDETTYTNIAPLGGSNRYIFTRKGWWASKSHWLDFKLREMRNTIRNFF